MTNLFCQVALAQNNICSNRDILNNYLFFLFMRYIHYYNCKQFRKFRKLHSRYVLRTMHFALADQCLQPSKHSRVERRRSVKSSWVDTHLHWQICLLNWSGFSYCRNLHKKRNFSENKRISSVLREEKSWEMAFTFLNDQYILRQEQEALFRTLRALVTW